MADQFKDWDRFYQHFTLTQDPKKSLGWLKHEKKGDKKREQNKLLEAHLDALEASLKPLAPKGG